MGLAALLPAGCGQDDREQYKAASSCRAETDNAARAAAIAQAYEDGLLGTQAEVESDFNISSTKIFDGSGHMIPFSDLKGIDKARFEVWMVSPSPLLRGGVRVRLLDARSRVRSEGYPKCPDYPEGMEPDT